MRAHFVFESDSASGIATKGSIELAAGSLVNRATLYLSRDWTGSLTSGDGILIHVFADDVTGVSTLFFAFNGLVSNVRQSGEFLLVEAVTPGSVLLRAQAVPKSWSNAFASSILDDLVGFSKLGSGFLKVSDSLSLINLHSWFSDSRVVAHEISDLLYSVSPDSIVYGSNNGYILIDDRAGLAKSQGNFAYPFDANAGAGADIEKSKFSLQPVLPHQVVYDESDSSFIGSVDSVTHMISIGQTFTQVVIDRTPWPDLVALVP